MQIEKRSEVLYERNDYISGSYHEEYARPPGTEACNKSGKTPKCLRRSDINGAFAGEHQTKLPGHNGSRDEKGNEA